MVKRIIAVLAIILGALMVIGGVSPMIIGAILEAQTSTSVGIIGGADGPTAVFVAGKLGIWSVIMEVLIGVFLIAAGIWGCWRCKK